MNYYQQNATSDDQGDEQNRSERIQVDSEEVRNHSEQNAETLRMVPHKNENIRNETSVTSERFARDKHAEQVQRESLDKSEKNALKELQMENYNLKVQLEGQKYLVNKFDDLVDGERERHEKEKLALVDRVWCKYSNELYDIVIK